jgi:hypothetical protein
VTLCDKLPGNTSPRRWTPAVAPEALGVVPGRRGRRGPGLRPVGRQAFLQDHRPAPDEQDGLDASMPDGGAVPLKVQPLVHTLDESRGPNRWRHPTRTGSLP